MFGSMFAKHSRRLRQSVFGMMVFIVLAGCGTAATPSTTTAPSQPQATTAPQTSGTPKVLVVGSGQDVENLDPHTGNTYSIRAIQRNVYDALLRYEGNPAKIVPHLAESWDVSANGLEYTFKLVKTAKFHDGTPVTADAVQFSFNRLLKLKKGVSFMFSDVMDMNSVQALDPYTVKIKLTKPFAPFLSVVPWLWVANPKVVQANVGSDDGQMWLKDHEAGSGPFVIKRWEIGNLYELERTKDYWKTAGAGNLTGAIWKVIREASSARLALQKGDIHIATDFSGDDMDALKGQPGIVLVEQPEFRTFSIKMNMLSGPLADINMRYAASYAFDYQAMLDAEGAGHAELMIGPLPNGILGADPKLAVPRQDLNKAKEFLAKSKNPNGGVKLTYVYVTGLEIERKFGLILLDSLKKLNIDLEIKQMVFPDMVALSKKPETTPDLFPVYQTANYADPDNVAFAAYHGSQNGNWTNPTYNSPEANALIDKARTTLGDEARAKLYADFQKQVVNDAPDIFGVLEKRKLAFRDSVQNWQFVPIASNAIEFYPLSLK